MDEWAHLRPNQAGISAWTLNTYIAKFDQLKQDLMREQQEEQRLEQERLAPVLLPVCFPGSDIPRFDLDKLQRMRKLPREVVQLVTTRQRAKQRQIEENSCLNYLELWRREFKTEVPGWHGSGHQLQTA